MARAPLVVVTVLAAFALGAMLLGRLSTPLMWADEAETAMFAQHALEYGYPKVHGERNVVYQFGPNIALGVKEGPDAYIGTTWGHFYWAIPGLLWARGTDDVHARTFRMRLPFALAGAVGIGLWLWALLPALAPGRRLGFAASFLLACAVSVSLLLHLREVRYYALVVLLTGAIARLQLGYRVYGTTPFTRYAVGVGLLLFLLFNTFFQAFFAVGLLLGVDWLLGLRSGRTTPRDLAPLVGSALLVAPLLVWFETLSTARSFASGLAFTLPAYLENLAAIAVHLLRHEFLAPAVLCMGIVVWHGYGDERLRGTIFRLAGLVVGVVLVGCLNPLALERYFVFLSPAVTGLFLLCAFTLMDGVDARRRSVAAGALIGLALFLRIPDYPALKGRIQEIRTPVRGPLDYVIPYLQERVPDPERLVIATNYEEYDFMYYLGSHTIIGLSLNNLVEDRKLEPDVVVPRRRWPRSLRELRPFLQEGDWEEVRFPVRDLHHNTVPALSRSRFIPDPHRFETATTDDPDEQLVIYLRSSSEKRTGTSSRP
jgi:hypothetical protein